MAVGGDILANDGDVLADGKRGTWSEASPFGAFALVIAVDRYCLLRPSESHCVSCLIAKADET